MTGHDSDLRLSHVAAAIAVGFAFLIRQLLVKGRQSHAAPARRPTKSYAR